MVNNFYQDLLNMSFLESVTVPRRWLGVITMKLETCCSKCQNTMSLAIKVTYHNDYTTGGFVHHWHMVFCSNVLKYPHHPHNMQSFLSSWLLQKLTQLWFNETQNRDRLLVIIDSPNRVQSSQGKVRDTQTDTGTDLVDPKLHCDQSGRHLALSFPSFVAVFKNLCTKMISLSMLYHII